MEHTNEKKEKSKRNIENDNDQELFKIMMAKNTTDPEAQRLPKQQQPTTKSHIQVYYIQTVENQKQTRNFEKLRGKKKYPHLLRGQGIRIVVTSHLNPCKQKREWSKIKCQKKKKIPPMLNSLLVKLSFKSK